jgi:FemAB-related protein (PEP-CTERM system-associated)
MAVSVQAILERPQSATIVVKEFCGQIAEAWDRWLHSYREGTPFHSTAWIRALETEFGYEPRCLYAERNGSIVGVLPLFLVSNWIVGRCLMSTPFADYGGVCAEDNASAEALVKRAQELALEERVGFLELRQRVGKLHPGFISRDLYVGFTCDLNADLETNFNNLPRDTRYMIRKGEKAGLELRSGVDEQLDAFYRLFAISWRRFGTPVVSRKWLEVLTSEFRDCIDLKLVYHKGRAVAGVLSLFFGDTVFPHYSGASDDSGRLSANNFMYWQLMKDACNRGMRHFDFGRSKRNTGAYQFKSSWNMKIATLDYETFLVRRKDAPNFTPVNPKFQMATQLWSRMPLPMTTWLGPRVVRWFP